MVVSDTCLARLVVEAGAAGATPKPAKSFCADSHSSLRRLISAVNADSGTVDKSMSVICPPSKDAKCGYFWAALHLAHLALVAFLIFARPAGEIGRLM